MVVDIVITEKGKSSVGWVERGEPHHLSGEFSFQCCHASHSVLETSVAGGLSNSSEKRYYYDLPSGKVVVSKYYSGNTLEDDLNANHSQKGC